MGWKGTVRSIGAAVRRHEREVQRRQRELEKQKKLYAKMEAMEQAAHEVAVYENHIEVIQSIHKEWGNLIDWEAIAKTPEPTEPTNIHQREKDFRPGLITKLLGNQDKAKAKVIKKDTDEYEKKYNKWKLDYAEWQDNKALANQLLANDEEAKVKAIEKMNPFKDISELGTTLVFTTNSHNITEAEINTHGQSQVPTEVKSLLQSGKLSTKKMPKGMFNEIYQDYVCSCVLRVGNELLAILPEKMVIVHVMDKMLNTKNGHMEDQCILSVAISRDTIKDLNMDMIDPSDSLDNFVHNMNFKKTKGFDVVEKLLPSSFAKSNNQA